VALSYFFDGIVDGIVACTLSGTGVDIFFFSGIEIVKVVPLSGVEMKDISPL